MADEINVDAFWGLLRQSGLVSDVQLRALITALGDDAKYQTARSLADELIKRGVVTDWQTDSILKGRNRGFHLGPYRLLRQLGQGGMSKVFLAEHEMMHRQCAIKVLPSKHQDDPDLLSRFHLEAMAVAKLDHPHIVRAYDFNKDVRWGKEIYYLVMEYIEGQDLRRMVDDGGPLDYRKAADFMSQAAEGLAHAHGAGFVHRDIKPANLLVDRNAILKILDLGLARFTFEGDHPWQTIDGAQSAVGTADYVAPEQVMDSRNVDGRSDIYGLGMTFYHILTGRRPFPKNSLPELLMAHKMEQPEPIGKFRPDVPRELVEIVDRMTAKNPLQRFQTAKEVAETLQTWLHGSESGREYSRISALMAAAMRAKQPQQADDAAPKTESAADLELAFLDDEPASPRKPAETKAGESSRSGIGKSGVAKAPAAAKAPGSGIGNKEVKPKVGDSGAHRSTKLSDLLADDLIAATSDPRMVAGVDHGMLPLASHATPIRRSAKSAVLSSPWLWVGLAGSLLAVVLLLMLLIPSSGNRTDRRPNGDAPPKTAVATPQTSEKQRPANVPPPAKTEPRREETQSSEDEDSSTSSETASPPSPKSEEPPPEPADEPKPPTDPTPTPKPEEKREPAPTKPSETEPPDPTKLLAEATRIGCELRTNHPDKNDPLYGLNLIVARQLAETTDQLSIRRILPQPPPPNVMQIEVSVSNAGGQLILAVSARLTCTPQGGNPVTVWSESEQVASIMTDRVSEAQAVKIIKLGVSKFFKRFADDVRKARAAVEK